MWPFSTRYAIPFFGFALKKNPLLQLLLASALHQRGFPNDFLLVSRIIFKVFVFSILFALSDKILLGVVKGKESPEEAYSADLSCMSSASPGCAERCPSASSDVPSRPFPLNSPSEQPLITHGQCAQKVRLCRYSFHIAVIINKKLHNDSVVLADLVKDFKNEHAMLEHASIALEEAKKNGR